MEKNFVVGVDVGGQTTKIGVIDKKGKILSQTVIRSDIFGSDENKYLQALADAINNVIAEAGKVGQIRGVGVGTETITRERCIMPPTWPGPWVKMCNLPRFSPPTSAASPFL